MNDQVYFPLHALMDDVFTKTTTADLQNYYLALTRGINKWTCYSDYCLDNPEKPNDVVCFTLMPYISDVDLLSAHIRSLAAVDIKNTNRVHEGFTTFLKEYPMINFSFIVNERIRLFGATHTEVKKYLLATFDFMRQQYIGWSIKQPEQKADYAVQIKKIDCVSKLLKDGKKVKQIVDLMLVSFLGAFVSSHIIKENQIEIFGWLSDRDAMHEVCGHFSTDMFHYYLHGLSDAKPFRFVAARAGSSEKPFYEEMIRIPDYIAGALADFNMESKRISKDKFNTMLEHYMAENTTNNFVYRIFQSNGTLSASRVNFHKK